MSDLVLLRSDEIDELEDRLRPFFASVAARSNGRYTVEGILSRARTNHWQIWLVVDRLEIVFVGGTEIVEYHDTGLRSLVIWFGTGKGRAEWQHHMDSLIARAKNAGCTFAEGVFRKGWRKVLAGWVHSHDHLERVLPRETQH